MRSGALVGLLLVTVLAGCIGGPGPEPGDGIDERWGPALRHPLPADPLPHGDGHAHGDPSQHRFLWNYDFSHRDALGQDPARIAGLHALQTASGYLFGAVYGHHAVSTNGGLVIWDLADPAKPAKVGHFIVPGHVGGDRSLGVSPDGDFAVLGAETVTCFGHVNPVPVQAYLIDTRDKADPKVADVITLPGVGLGSQTPTPRLGIHSVYVHNIGGEDYAFIWGRVYQIDRSAPSGGALVDTGVLVPAGHDLFVRDTPWGDVWGLAANEEDFRVFDLTNPLEPRLIALFDAVEGHYLHTADVAFLDDGHIAMVLTSEDWEDHPSPFWVFNATGIRTHTEDEPFILEPVHTWTNPSNRTAVNMHFSLHNPRFHDGGILSLSSYHGGLWQFDLRHPEFRARPAEIGYAVYAEDGAPLLMDPVQNVVEGQLCGLGLGLDTPMYTDVEIGPRGILYAADVMMGLYVFTPTADHPVFGDDA